MERGRFVESIGRGLKSTKDFVKAKPLALPFSVLPAAGSLYLGLVFWAEGSAVGHMGASIIIGLGLGMGARVLYRDIQDYKRSLKETHSKY